MINANQLEDILEGHAYLECLGNLYEYIGYKNGKFLFQSVSDDYHIEASYETLLNMPEYEIQY